MHSNEAVDNDEDNTRGRGGDDVSVTDGEDSGCCKRGPSDEVLHGPNGAVFKSFAFVSYCMRVVATDRGKDLMKFFCSVAG